MADDKSAVVASIPSTPLMWVEFLFSKLAWNRDKYRTFTNYYDGQHQKLVFSQARHKGQFAQIFEKWQDNFCGLIIDSVNERLGIDGFRMTEEPEADKDARDI